MDRQVRKRVGQHQVVRLVAGDGDPPGAGEGPHAVLHDGDQKDR